MGYPKTRRHFLIISSVCGCEAASGGRFFMLFHALVTGWSSLGLFWRSQNITFSRWPNLINRPMNSRVLPRNPKLEGWAPNINLDTLLCVQRAVGHLENCQMHPRARNLIENNRPGISCSHVVTCIVDFRPNTMSAISLLGRRGWKADWTRPKDLWAAVQRHTLRGCVQNGLTMAPYEETLVSRGSHGFTWVGCTVHEWFDHVEQFKQPILGLPMAFH